MKYIILLCDGMSDYPIPSLGDKTPMQAAHKPHMDALAKKARLGLCKTVRDGMTPGSDVANLSVIGYDPALYYTGRSPLEAASIGVDMAPADVSLRCNLVTLSDEPVFADKTMLDYCADDISNTEAAELITFLNGNISKPPYSFYSGVSYRNLLLWKDGSTDLGKLTPPHDITGQKVRPYIIKNADNAALYGLMEEAAAILPAHPVNINRVKNKKRPANAIWLWGEGRRSALPPFKEKYGLAGAMISAVDLLKGIGKLIGLDVINVEGATGYLDTNFAGKAAAAVKALKDGADFVYLHVEAPDECGHRGETANKVKALELIDGLVLAPILDALADTDIRILIMPDHSTPLSLRAHTNDRVPFLLYDSTDIKPGADTGSFCEEEAAKSGVCVQEGYKLMDMFLGK